MMAHSEKTIEESFGKYRTLNEDEEKRIQVP